MKARHFSAAAWVIGGQGLTAAGTLLGIRLLTQVLPPAGFAVVSLGLGVVTLALNVASAPLTQAAMHLYPGLCANGTLPALAASLLRCFKRMAVWALPAVAAAVIAYVALGAGTLWLPLLLLCLLVLECWRSVNLSLLNAARRHERYAVWMTCDAWAKPLLAAAAVLALGASPVAALGAYVLASVLLSLIFSRVSFVHMSWPGHELDRRLWQYAVPLIPLGLLGWANNLGDRYLIGWILGLGDAGLYAAAYALSSAPFMLTGGTIEQALRPVYQDAVSAGNRLQAQRVFGFWLLAVAAICGCGVVIVSLWHEYFAAIFLGPAYRHAAVLMPWIAAGYALRAVAYVFERVCYAYGQTRRVLFGQIFAALAALIATPVGALSWGLKGAAAAVPICFAVQLVISIYFAHKTHRQAQAPVSAAAGSPTVVRSAL